MLKIKEVREEKKLSQDEVVRLSGIPKRSYINYENGQTDVPISKLQNIASALGVSILKLIDNKHQIEEPKEEYQLEKKTTLLDVRDDLKADLAIIAEGMTTNFEKVAGALYESLKGQQKIIRFIEKIDPDKINKATGKLDEFLERK
ncbi:helix-turn-helix domain-containing protein [Zunongwangia profunda]|uniref:helix-turn-helix domain-containing protein n=1 Tax=Zunongwangia profunda TaxID=398743 RepID=UPI001D17F651|nr:helix-turn-helix transcriptional regulator [Zunongwangia profunda]MCC4228414.1 helix-turn-helix transcriptional regulator [Zunongwangia profunda]